MVTSAAAITDSSVAPGSLSISAPFAANRVDQTIAFTGAAGVGAVGTVDLYTVTGSVFVYVMAICTENLTEAGATATVEVGIAGITAGLISQTNAVNIDNGEVWLDNSPAAMEVFSSIGGGFIAGGADIILTVGAQNVDDGTLDFYCFWTPLAAGSTVVAA
jgi:hypothetical protein